MAGAKTPPRFVPTLTDVVHVPGDGRPPMAAQAAPVQPQAQAPAPQAPSQTPSPQDGVAASGGLPRDFEEYVVHRVMQRVDVALDQRLREAIAQVVQEQTRFLVPACATRWSRWCGTPCTRRWRRSWPTSAAHGEPMGVVSSGDLSCSLVERGMNCAMFLSAGPQPYFQRTF